MKKVNQRIAASKPSAVSFLKDYISSLISPFLFFFYQAPVDRSFGSQVLESAYRFTLGAVAGGESCCLFYKFHWCLSAIPA